MKLFWKRHGAIVVAMFALALAKHLPFFPDALTDLGVLVLFFLFLYRLNVEDRLRKTWNHFQSLPLSLAERAVARVAVPVVLNLALYAIVDGMGATAPDRLAWISKTAFEGALLVVASLWARSAFKYLVLGFVAVAVSNAASGPVALVGAFVATAWAVRLLSGRRVRFLRAAVPAAIVGLILAGAMKHTVGWPVEKVDSEISVEDDGEPEEVRVESPERPGGLIEVKASWNGNESR